MAQLILATAGAFVGSYFGPWGTSIGWSIGAMLGAPHQRVEGPRLADLRVQSSSYGRMLPIVYGCARIPGNVIDSSDLREVRSESDVGKGGGATQVTYSYNVDAAVELCEGPIGGVLRIWADGRLIYDAKSGDPESTKQSLKFAQYMTVYLGDETQAADPTMETLHGAGNVPGYRGRAYVVFTALPLEDYGNRLPNFEFEVTSGAVTAGITQLSSTLGNLDSFGIGYMGDSILTRSTSIVVDDTLRQTWVRRPLDGSATDTWTSDTALTRNPTWTSSGTSYEFFVVGNQALGPIAVRKEQEGLTNVAWWLGKDYRDPLPSPVGDGDYYAVPGGPILFVHDYGMGWNGHYYGVVQTYSAGDYLLRYSWFQQPDGSMQLDAGNSSLAISAALGSGGGTWRPIVDEITGKAYVFNGIELYELNAETLSPAGLDVWDFSGVSGGVNGGAIGGQVYGGYFAVHNRSYDGNDARIELYRLNAGGSYTLITRVGSMGLYDSVTVGLESGVFAFNSGGAGLIDQITLSGTAPTVTLSDIVADLCDRAGLAAAQYDTAALTDEVTGYYISNSASVRVCIEQLASGYFFDAAEVDGKIVFVKRDGSSVARYALDDLAATGDPIAATRAKETDLPRVVNVRYYNAASDYQLGAQLAQRMVTSTSQITNIDLPISFTDAEAAQIADVHLYWAWAARTSYTFTLPISELARAPCDVVTVETDTGDVAIFLRSVRWEGVRLACEGVQFDSGVLTPNTSAEAIARTQALDLTTIGTEWELMDVSALRDEDGDHVTYYAAGDVGFYTGANWPGAQIYRSTDRGGTWTEASALLDLPVMGITQSKLADFAGAPDTIDEHNSVTVKLHQGTLTDCSHEEMLAGTNAAVIGSEIVCFRDVTYASGIYTLSGLYRGYRGSEWASSGHETNERFVLLSTDGSVQTVRGAPADLGNIQNYKAVTFGMRLDEWVDIKSITSATNSAKPLAPQFLFGSVKANDDIVISVTRRDRKRQETNDYVDTPMSEESAVFDFDILDTDDATIVRTVTAATSPYTYAAADQVADFGFYPRNFLTRAYQRSGLIGRGQVKEARVLAPIVLGPRDYEDFIVPADQIATSGTQSVVSALGGNRCSNSFNAGVHPRIRFTGIGQFRNGRITLNFNQPQTPSGSGVVFFRTTYYAEGGYLGWYVYVQYTNVSLYWGSDASSGGTTLVTTVSGPGNFNGMASLRVVFSGTYFELWSGDSIPNLAKIWSGTNSNKNQSGWCGIAGGSPTNSGYLYWDDVTIENWD